MASRELRKKRGAVASPARQTGQKEREKVIVQPAAGKSRVDNSKTKAPGQKGDADPVEQTSRLEEEENTKDTGQEKDAGQGVERGGSAGGGKSPPGKGPGTMDSPRYLRSPREKSRERSSSPFHRNVVEPLPAAAASTSANQGSLASLKSETSTGSKEAWPERKDSVSTSKGRKDSVSSQASRPSQKQRKESQETPVDSVSIQPGEREQNAYIPYMYARNCIARITGDMTTMKTKHLAIVKDIEKHYRAIEDETQVQFNGFVLMLRQQYTGKVATFRQVIDIHRNELTKKEEYWNETMQSMTDKINSLMKDRKILLVSNKKDVENLEQEKALLMAQLTSRMDQEKSAAVVRDKDFEKRVNELEDSNEKLRKELEAEKAETERLRAAAASGTAVAMATVATTKEDVKQDKASVEKSAPSKEEQERMSEDRQQREEDRVRMGEERQDLVDKIKDLQADVTRLSLESSQREEKCRLLLLQAGEAERVREQYARLESQYKALSLLVAADQNTAQVAKEKAEQVETERAMMEEERQRLEKEIKKWEADFKKKNKREPTEDDKPDSAKELYVSMGEVEQMVGSLEQQKATLHAVETGKVPDTPDLPPAHSASVVEPEVSVVEVRVPDPDIVVSLEKSQATVDDLQSRLADLQQENSDLRSQLADGPSGQTVTPVAAAAVIQDFDAEKVEKLTAELEDRDAELLQLRAEKREMAKDMKKMMRQYDKLQGKLADADPDLPKLLQMVAVLVQSIHGEHPAAAAAVEKRLGTAQEAVKPLKEKDAASKKALKAWDKKYRKTHDTAPSDADRDEEGQGLKLAHDDASKAFEIKQLEVRALTLLTTGIFKPQEDRPKSAKAAPETDTDEQLAALDNKLIDLEGENERLELENRKLQGIVEDQEASISELREQLALQATVGTAVVSADLSEDTSELNQEVDNLNTALQQERAAHDATREELELVQKQMQEAKDSLSQTQAQAQAEVQKATAMLQAALTSKEEQLADVQKRNDELEKERLANVPIDTAKEIKNLQNKIALLGKEKEEVRANAASNGAAIMEVKGQLDAANRALEAQRAANRELEGRVKTARTDKEKAVKELNNQLDKKEQQRAALESKLKALQAGGAAAVGAAAVKAGAGKKAAGKGAAGGEDTAALKREIRELNVRIKQLEAAASKGGPAAVIAASDGGASERNMQKRHEKILKELERRYEIEQSKNAKLSEAQKSKDEELKILNKDVKEKDNEVAKLRAELATLGVAAKEGVEAAGKVKGLEVENKKLAEENKVLTENYNSERVLRKKYYNMVEDMKGKIRVYCRARPMSSQELDRGNTSVLKSPDEYSIQVSSQRGLKEFQFDQIFMEDSSQEKVFEDTNNLIQSAVDGYNVCIFAYGQTGSGKTFTMIGDRDQKFPGIAPRAFQRIFEMGQENKKKFDMTVTAYMLELYNEKLIDLFARPDLYDEDKLDIKKDKKGMVFIQGAVVKSASNAKELNALFEEGSKNRHTASTKMNAESSRSHLVIGIVMESINKSTGNVVKGKLSLVDLAGSERVGKTGATADQLKEAMSINKSLSALGDVISALSSEQQFIPYRNNKLTMLMQDSLGGNAKTLMFVNISPADYNCDESVISLTYASRVKLITNDASKNADNKEIARLKAVIAKLKAGERVEEEETA